jgi:hypothetical protein
MKKTLPLIACLSLILAAPAMLGAAKFYKWTDAQGVTHYSEGPPPESSRNASEVKVPTRLPSGSPAPANAPKAAASPAKKDGKADKKEGKVSEKSEEAAAGNERYAERCKQLRTNLQTMQEHARIKVSDEKGESRVLSDEEKNNQLDDIQRQIKAYCE